jgi:hypothetical protein
MEVIDMTTDQERIEILTKELISKGKLIHAGWLGYVAAVYRNHLTDGNQYDQLQQAFFAGAQHLFASIMNVLDPGDEITNEDLEKIAMIHNELEQFIEVWKLKYITKPEGNA